MTITQGDRIAAARMKKHRWRVTGIVGHPVHGAIHTHTCEKCGKETRAVKPPKTGCAK